MLAPGTTLGPYKIVAPLGAGGMGEVYRARDTRLARDVAVKVLPPGFATDRERLRRFEQEARAAGALDHPNIVAIHDIGSYEGGPYVVMELLEGGSLRERLRAGALGWRQAVDCAEQVARGLAAAHAKGIVHRDLKPENLFLMKDGRVKVLDFGLAKLTRPETPAMDEDAPTASLALTETGAVLGTVGYMSPEQARGLPADARSDIFALGAILHEMLSGQRAFQGTTIADTLSAILRDEAGPLGGVRKGLPAGLEAVIARCLEKEPDARYQSAGDLAHDLGKIGEGGQTSPPPIHHPRWLAWPAAALAVGAIAAGVWLAVNRGQPRPSPPPDAHPRTAIAVLPFANLSAAGPHAFMAPGLHDELLTQLSKVASLKVISRTSVMGYANTTKPLKQIADELGVGSIVEGSVQVAGDRLRVNVQLIDAATDEHLWAESYDRTLDDAFAIQSDVAQRVVDAVGAVLASGERQAIAAAPTANAEAYQLFLQGQQYAKRPGHLREDLHIAQGLYERAIALDPDFALAHAELSQAHGIAYWYRYDTSPARAARQREQAAIALKLAPDLPQAHTALGFDYYYGRREYGAALKEFHVALRGLPNDADLWAAVGFVERRLGNWPAVDSAYRQAVRLDPRNAQVIQDLGGNTFGTTRRYVQAVQAYDRALELAPDFHDAALQRANTFTVWKGELDTLVATLDRIPGDVDLGPRGSPALWRARAWLWAREPDSLLALVARSPLSVFESQTIFEPLALYSAWAHRLRGDEPQARDAFRRALGDLEPSAGAMSEDWRFHAARGYALAGLGRKAEALREAHWLQESPVYRGDAFQGSHLLVARALILAHLDEADGALDEIERLLAGPTWISVHLLRLDPRWDPIREHPRFKALLVKYANPGA